MWTNWCESYKSVAQKIIGSNLKKRRKEGYIHMGNNDSSVETFLQWIKASDNIVFFGGAGVSTESGIPDFRSVDGLYNQKYDYPPETILSHTFYRKHPQEFYRFYRDKMLCLDAEPNITCLLYTSPSPRDGLLSRMPSSA